jgi:Cdc6-like AAA superfamily ATPase
MADIDEYSKIAACGRVFCPAAPINQFQLFRGRKEQLQSVIAAITTRGKHVVLYGDRGVGKTSLANILKDALGRSDSTEVVKINCNEGDYYAEVWRRSLAEIQVIAELPDENGDKRPLEYALSHWVDTSQTIGSGEIKKILNIKCSDEHELIIIFDEVDRLQPEQRRFFADTIKDLSDSSTNVTIMLIGVAHTLTELISEHRSIERCISQIFMPPMAKGELRDVIENGLRALKMKMETETKELIISLSRGYPFYTHLLCNEACIRAIKGRSDTVNRANLSDAIRAALKNAQASVCNDYIKAADGQRKGSNYPNILLACALAKTDELGYFKPTDLQWPADEMRGSKFSEPLHKLATDGTRGLVLERFGTPRKYKFRFRNPLIKPYIIMKGITDGCVKGQLLDGLGIERVVQRTLFDFVD